MSVQNIKTVGFVGLGKMGLPMAQNTLKAGFRVVGFDQDQEAASRAKASGIEVLPGLSEISEHSDLVIIIVGFESQIESIIFGEGGLASSPSQSIFAVASTVSPSFMVRTQERLKGTRYSLVDIPVARGEQPARDGTLLLFFGGSIELFERCGPVFDSFCEKYENLGPLGCGQVGKMVNNMILWSCLVANVEAFSIAEKFGIDQELLREILTFSSGDNWALRTKADQRPAFWAEKDMMILLSEADKKRVSLPLSGAVKEAIKAFKIDRDLPYPEEF